MGVEIEDVLADGGGELLGRRDGDDTRSGGEKFWEKNVQGAEGHGVVDRVMVFVEGFHEKGFEASTLPSRSDELEDGAGGRDSPSRDEFSCSDGEEREMNTMMSSSTSKMHRDGIDVHEKMLGGGQGVDGP